MPVKSSKRRRPEFGGVRSQTGEKPAILRAMLNSTVQGVAMFDAGRRLVGWNRQLEELLDLTGAVLSAPLVLEDFVGILARRGDFGTQPKSIDTAVRELTTALDQAYVAERMLPDGRVLECRRHALPEGGFVMLYSDTSEQRHAEYLVKDSERQVRTILDKAPVALAVISQEDGLLKQVNGRFRRLFGLDIGISPEAIDLAAHLVDEEVEKIVMAQPGAASMDFETVVRRADGSEFWALVSPVPFVFEWAPAVLTGFYDVTDRHRAELALREELQRKQAELKEARILQLELAPPPVRGVIGGRPFAIDLVLEPAKEIGGDLVDYFEIDDDLLVLALGDVSHKGAGAALFMARTHSLIRGIAVRPDAEALFRDPAGAANLINAALSKNNATSMFVTLLLACFDGRTSRLSYVRAGHLPPLLRTASGEIQTLAGLGGPPLGLVENVTHKSASIGLAPGDSVLIVTDGVTEAADPSGALFGETRVREFLAAAEPDKPAPLAGLMAAIRHFEAGLAASDDVAALLFALRGP